jgi:hypothetical protein
MDEQGDGQREQAKDDSEKRVERRRRLMMMSLWKAQETFNTVTQSLLYTSRPSTSTLDHHHNPQSFLHHRESAARSSGVDVIMRPNSLAIPLAVQLHKSLENRGDVQTS